MEQFANQMANGGNGMIEQHARPGPSHDGANAVPHLRPIAVDGALLTRRFVCTKAAVLQAAWERTTIATMCFSDCDDSDP